MAEAFARAYGSDILIVQSAGLAPATACRRSPGRRSARKIFRAKASFRRPWSPSRGEAFDVVVNLSGERLPPAFGAARLIEWNVRDPIGENEDVYRAVAAQIEGLVMRLILELRGS